MSRYIVMLGKGWGGGRILGEESLSGSCATVGHVVERSEDGIYLSGSKDGRRG